MNESDSRSTLNALMRRSCAWRAVALSLETLAIAFGSAGFACAAVEFGGGAWSHPHALGAAVLVGACAGASWWIEHPPTRARLVRKLERAFDAPGELSAALEPHRGDVAEALRARVRARFAARGTLRALGPRALLLVAAPLCGVAALLTAMELGALRSREALQLLDAARAVAGAAGAAGAAQADAPRTERLDALATALREAARAIEHEPLDSSRRVEALERVRRSLERAAAVESTDTSTRSAATETIQPPAVRDALAAAQAAVNAAVPFERALSASSSVSDATSGDATRGDATRGDEAPADVSVRPASVGHDATGGGGDAAGMLAGSARDGRMSGPPSPTGLPNSSPVATPVTTAGAEAGLADARWWPEAQDALVRAFLDPARRP